MSAGILSGVGLTVRLADALGLTGRHVTKLTIEADVKGGPARVRVEEFVDEGRGAGLVRVVRDYRLVDEPKAP